MNYLTVSTIAGSGGCSRKLFSEIRDRSTRRRRGGFIVAGNQSERDDARQVGTGVHRVIQYALEQIPSERQQVSDLISAELIQVKDDLENGLPPLLESILGQEFLNTAIRDRRLMKLWKEGADLLNCANNLLSTLELSIPESLGNWEITAEGSVHQMKDVQRLLFGEQLYLHGDIDLIFRYKNFHILGELKTGRKEGWKEKQWILQMQIYLDLWNEIHPDVQVAACIIHRSLYDGYKWVEMNREWPQIFTNPDDCECIDCTQISNVSYVR
jgi:hypothetical protein